MEASRPAVGGYKLLRSLGRGGMADVWQAERRRIGRARKVALKRIRPELCDQSTVLRMFRREASLALKLRHPNVIGAVDAGEHAGQPYLALELVDGIDLRRFLVDSPPLPIGFCAYVVRELCVALAYVHRLHDDDGHSLRVVHGDVTPANVMLCLDGAVKLFDFGVARARRPLDTATTESVLRGTPGYLAPEALDGAKFDHRADLFACGVVLYRLLTRVDPFQAPTPHLRVLLNRRCRVDKPSSLEASVPPELDAITMRALARNPDQRYASADEMVAALDGVLERWPCSREDAARLIREHVAQLPASTDSSYTPTEVGRLRPHRRRFRPLVVLLLVLGFCAPFVAIGLFHRDVAIEPAETTLPITVEPVRQAFVPKAVPVLRPWPVADEPSRPSRTLRPGRSRSKRPPALDGRRLFNPFEATR